MTQVLFGGNVARSLTFTVFPEAFPFSSVFSSRMIVWFPVATDEPLAEDERNEPMLGIHGTRVSRPPTTAKSVRNLRLDLFAGAPAGRGGGGGAGGALLSASADIYIANSSITNPNRPSSRAASCLALRATSCVVIANNMAAGFDHSLKPFLSLHSFSPSDEFSNNFDFERYFRRATTAAKILLPLDSRLRTKQ